MSSDIQYKEQKLIAQRHELEEKEDIVNRQSREIASLKIALADAKAEVQKVALTSERQIENAREDAFEGMKALKDLPQELRQAHNR